MGGQHGLHGAVFEDRPVGAGHTHGDGRSPGFSGCSLDVVHIDPFGGSRRSGDGTPVCIVGAGVQVHVAELGICHPGAGEDRRGGAGAGDSRARVPLRARASLAGRTLFCHRVDRIGGGAVGIGEDHSRPEVSPSIDGGRRCSPCACRCGSIGGAGLVVNGDRGHALARVAGITLASGLTSEGYGDTEILVYSDVPIHHHGDPDHASRREGRARRDGERGGRDIGVLGHGDAGGLGDLGQIHCGRNLLCTTHCYDLRGAVARLGGVGAAGKGVGIVRLND